jgi:hypothetical protein
VNGSVPVLGVMTVVDVTTGTVVPDPTTGSVVVVVTNKVVAETRSVVVVSGCVVVVGPFAMGAVVTGGAVVDVVDDGVVVLDGVVGGTVVLVVVVVVLGGVVVVVLLGGGVVLVVLFGGGVVLVVLRGGRVLKVVVLLECRRLIVVLVVEVVVLDVDEDAVLDVDEDAVDDVDDGGCALGPQNCTFETSGVFPWPTFGRPPFEKVPLNCGGVIEVYTDDGPPFTITPDTPSVDCHVAPEADAPVRVTTCSFPAGFSKLYDWWSKLNFAINTEPDGHD